MGDVIEMDMPTKQDLLPNKVLEETIKADVDEVIVVGMKDDELYFAASPGSQERVPWLLALAQKDLLEDD